MTESPASEVNQIQGFLWHNIPFLLAITAFPSAAGGWSRHASLPIPPVLQGAGAFVLALVLMQGVVILQNKWGVAPPDILTEAKAQRGRVSRAVAAIPLFFFGFVLGNPVVAAAWGAGFAIVFAGLILLVLRRLG